MSTQIPTRQTVTIYGLYTDKNDTIRYIGKTKFSLKKRLHEHVKNKDSSKTHKNHWINKSLENNEKILIKIIEVCDKDNWQEREIFWISKLKNKNKLTNLSQGGEGGHLTLYKWSYKKLKKYVNEKYSHITSSIQWEKTFMNNKEKPLFIPANPEVVYKNRGWTTWGHFLNTGRIQSNVLAYEKYIDYESAKTFLKEMNIKNIEDYKILKRDKIIPETIPLKPNRFYKNKGWASWNDFLSNNNVSNIKRHFSFLLYNEAKQWLADKNIKSRSEYYNFYILNKNDIEFLIPKSPDVCYKKNGWISWGNFLSMNKISDIEKHKNYLSYDEAKLYMKENFSFIKSGNQWKNYRKSNLIPTFIPANPENTYKITNDWKGWSDYIIKNK